MLAEDEIRQGADGYQLLEVHGIVEDLWAGPLIEMDDSIDESCCPNFDPPRISQAFLDRSRLGAYRLYDAAQHDDDSTLDEWLASMPPDQFEHVFECLASLQHGPLNSLEPTA